MTDLTPTEQAQLKEQRALLKLEQELEAMVDPILRPIIEEVGDDEHEAMIRFSRELAKRPEISNLMVKIAAHRHVLSCLRDEGWEPEEQPGGEILWHRKGQDHG